MQTIQLLGINPTDLVQEIKNAIIPELTRQLSAEFQPKTPTEYLTRTEVCKLLQINYSTLHRWRKDGVLRAYCLQNRVYFKRSEIELLIDKNKL